MKTYSLILNLSICKYNDDVQINMQTKHAQHIWVNL